LVSPFFYPSSKLLNVKLASKKNLYYFGLVFIASQVTPACEMQQGGKFMQIRHLSQKLYKQYDQSGRISILLGIALRKKYELWRIQRLNWLYNLFIRRELFFKVTHLRALLIGKALLDILVTFRQKIVSLYLVSCFNQFEGCFFAQ
jgi:hypothetical protein